MPHPSNKKPEVPDVDIGEQRLKAYDRDVHIPRMAGITGLLYGCGAVFVASTAVLPHPDSLDTAGILAVAIAAAIAFAGITSFSHSFRKWGIHAILLIGSGLIAACVYFSGTASGIYSAMYVWVVLVAGRSFSARGLAAQLAGIGLTYAVALSQLDLGPTEFPDETRWILTVFALTVTGVISLRLTDDAKRREADLLRLSHFHQQAGATRAQPAETRSLSPL